MNLAQTHRTLVSGNRWRPESPTLLEKHVVRCVRSTMEGAGLIARTGVDPALRVDLLHRCHARECPPAAVRGRSEFEPRNVVRPLAGHMGQYFGRHGAAVHVLPVRAGGMVADRLAVEQERRDRLAGVASGPSIAARLSLLNFGGLPP